MANLSKRERQRRRQKRELLLRRASGRSARVTPLTKQPSSAIGLPALTDVLRNSTSKIGWDSPEPRFDLDLWVIGMSVTDGKPRDVELRFRDMDK